MANGNGFNQDENEQDPLAQTLLQRQQGQQNQNPWNGQNMSYLQGGPALGTLGTAAGNEGAGQAWATGSEAPAPYNPWAQWGSGPGLGGTTDNPTTGTGASDNIWTGGYGGWGGSEDGGWGSVVPIAGPGWEYKPNSETGEVDTRPISAPGMGPDPSWPKEWQDLYRMTGGRGGINPPWLHRGEYQIPGGESPTGPGKVGPDGVWRPSVPNADDATKVRDSFLPGDQVGGTAPTTGGSSPWYPEGFKPVNQVDGHDYVPTFANTPVGFDNRKWADPNKHDPKYDAGRIIAAGGSIQDAAKAAGGVVVPGSRDKIKMPDGTVYDAIFAEDGEHRAQWIPVEGPGANGGGAPNSGSTGGAFGISSGNLVGDPRVGPQAGGGALASGGSSGGGTGGGSSTSGINNVLGGTSWDLGGEKASGLYQTLMDRANQSLNIDRKDPIIANQLNNFNANQTRQNRHYLEGVAEKAGPQANMAGETRMANERAAQAGGQFQAELMGRELQARRAEIQASLAQQGQLLTDEQRMGLQRELAQLDNAYRYYAANQQNAQFYGRLGLDAEDRAAYWDSVRSGLNG